MLWENQRAIHTPHERQSNMGESYYFSLVHIVAPVMLPKTCHINVNETPTMFTHERLVMTGDNANRMQVMTKGDFQIDRVTRTVSRS